ncbi:MAG: helicase-related protein [Chloroflexales bacterium]
MTTLLPGTEVFARDLRWEVVATESLGMQTLYRLRCLQGDLSGQELDLLSPFEPITAIRRELRPERAAPLVAWRAYHQAFLLEQALGPDALLVAQPGRLRLEPYQLVPVLRAIRMSRVRLLLADGVGLGKTIQAGLVITELIARRVAHRILIVSPAGPLLEQWRVELAERFGLRMERIDRELLETVRKANELGANPFDSIPLGLVSIDFLKQESVLIQLERASYDVVVIDEAHHCMDLGVAQERADSQRRTLADLLARRSDALLLLTATPHDGNDRSFASLCELLDPSLVDGRGQLRGERYRPFVVRRLKHHITDAATGLPRFRERVVTPCPVSADPARHAAFIALQRGLMAMIAPELRRAFRTRQFSDVLAYLALLKRSVSSVAACKETLDVVASRFQRIVTEGAESQDSRRQRLRTLREYQRRLDRFGTISAEEEQEQRMLEAEDLAQQLVSLDREVRSGARRQAQQAHVIDQIEELIGLASKALMADPKLDHLIAEVRAIRTAEPRANVLIYTEYTDSQQAVARALDRAGRGTVLLMSGEDGATARGDVTERFRSADGLVLVSTDAAAEGLNLQQRCHHLIHLELPFNPNRLEQRNGRIDRFGQTHDPQVRYLYLRATFEERILLRLIAKYERQRARLTFVPNTLGLSVATDLGEARLLEGLMDEDERLFDVAQSRFDFGQVDENAGSDNATRELLEEIDRSLRGFEDAARTNRWLGDLGMNADADQLVAADAARAQGASVSAVDLSHFVRDAVLLDGGDVRDMEPTVSELTLPPDWAFGLDDLPGYVPATRQLRVTTDRERTCDDRGNPVGYLGRAHPLVRRALDRVRHRALGGDASHGQDVRVSAVRGPVAAPTLLFTFVGRVLSGVGRELERVLGVRCQVSGARGQGSGARGPDTGDAQPQIEVIYLPTPEIWLDLADPVGAIRTTGVYAQHFAGWYAEAQARARALAEQEFCTGLPTIAFIAERRNDVEAERVRQQEWLRARAAEICGSPTPAAAVQVSLFDLSGTPIPHPVLSTGWASLDDPALRLAGFAVDVAQPVRLRSEADGVLRISRQRLAALDERAALRPPEVVELGALMVVPLE